MTEIMLKGNKIHTNGTLPAVGTQAPDFLLVSGDLKDQSLESFSGKRKILATVPSLDTTVCMSSAKKINEKVKSHKNTLAIYISADLPFAQKRACVAADTDTIITLSMMRDKKFGEDYGILIMDGPFAGILARAIIILDEKNTILYTEIVNEISNEPNYEAFFGMIS